MSERFPSPAASPLPASLDSPAGTARRRRSALETGILALTTLAALVLGAVAAPGVASEVNSTQLSDGHTYSEVWFASTPPQVSPDGQYAVYVQDAITNGAHELWSVPLAGGNPVRLSDVLLPGQSVKFAISPDSNYVVYVTDQDVVGVPELFSVRITGTSRRKLNMDYYSLPGQIIDFLISPTSQRVYYTADGEVNNVVELWRVDIDGGTSTRLNSEITSTYDIYEFAVGVTTGGTERVVYRVGKSTVSEYELWSVSGTGSSTSAGRISRTIDSGVEPYFQISPSGTRVLYSSDSHDASFNLISVAITGGGSIQLNGALGGADGVEPGFRISPDSTKAVYRSDEGTDSVIELYSVDLMTGNGRTKLNGALPSASADVDELAISPNGARVVYLADQFLLGLEELWTVPIGGGTATRLNDPIGGGSDVLDFAISPDSARVVYRADSTDTLNELWSVPLGGGTVTRLNRTLAAGGDVQAFLISPDSSWVVYGADQDQDGKDELLRVPLAGGTVEDVNDPLVFGGDVSLTFLLAPVFTISPDSLNIVYAADQVVDDEIELFKSVVGGPPGAPLDAVAVAGDSQATVTFAPPVSDGGSPITDYTVTPDPATVGWIDNDAGTAATTHLITGLANGTEYTFTVRAANAYGVGEASTPSDPVTPATLPGAPVISGPGLGATGWNNAASVAFAPPASNGGSAITGYVVNWTSVPNTPGGVDIHAGNPLLNHFVRLLTNGVSYTFTVRAINGIGMGPASLPSNVAIPACDANLLCDSFELANTSAWTPPPALNVVKTVTSSGPYEVGSSIDYTIVVTNTAFLTLTGVTVTDPGAVVGTCTPAQPATVDASETLICPATHVVTQADLDAGSYLNTATADSDQTGPDTDGANVTFTQTPALAIDKTAAQLTFTLEGEIIDYSFAVTNAGNVTLAGPFSVADDKTTDEVCPPTATLAPGAAITCTATYTITLDDITAGLVTNTASATNGDETVTSPPDSVTIPYLGSVSR